MKVASLMAAAIAAALLVAAVAQAASLKKRMDSIPAPASGAAAAVPEEPPVSPYETAELLKRLEACASRLDGKIDKESKELKAAKERYAGLKAASDESLAKMTAESSKIKEELGQTKGDKEKVAELTKKIRTEQQKAMFKKFMGEQVKKELEKIKVELGLSPDQAAKFDAVNDEMFDKFAEMGSSFMDGEGNPQKFQELITESNTKMKGFMTDDQFTKYTDIQKKQWGGRQRNQEGKNGLEGGDQGGQQ